MLFPHGLAQADYETVTLWVVCSGNGAPSALAQLPAHAAASP